MKLLTATLVSLCASLALAHGEVQINWPSVNGLAVNNACATSESFRSLNGVQVCTATKLVRYAVHSQGEQGLVKRLLKVGEFPRRGEYLESESVCAAYATQAREVSRFMTVTECAHYAPAGEHAEPCSEFVSKTVKAGTTFSVEKIVDYGQASQQSFFNYTVPSCQ